MATHEMIYVFCYDITRDRLREKAAELLDGVLVRVQRSVYEGRLSEPAARRLAEKVHCLIEPGDSLRVYAISAAGLKRSASYGPQPLPEASDFFLL